MSKVLNDTADLYRYFDCTHAAEFLYACVHRTVEEDLPREIEYLRRHDQAIQRTPQPAFADSGSSVTRRMTSSSSPIQTRSYGSTLPPWDIPVRPTAQCR